MSIRPEKTQSNRFFRRLETTRRNGNKCAENGLYFSQREKCWAQGTRIGMNSSTIPCPSRNEAKEAFTKREIRAPGKLRRRFRRKGTRIARSPRFQYSITRILLGCALAGRGERGDGSSRE